MDAKIHLTWRRKNFSPLTNPYEGFAPFNQPLRGFWGLPVATPRAEGVPPFNGGLNLPPRTVVSAGSPRPLFFNHFCCIDFNMFFLCFFTQILINLFMFFNDFYIISPAHFLYGLGKFVFHILLFCRVLVFS